MKTYNTKFGFKGTRQYVQGADMYTELMGILEGEYGAYPFKRTVLNINKLVTKQCKVHVSAFGESVALEPTPQVVLRVETDDGQISCFMVEGEDVIHDRRTYDESAVEEQCTFSENSVRIEGAIPYLPCEIVVAATKFLHYKLLPAENKWIFTKIDLKRPFEDGDTQRLIVTLTHNLGQNLTKSSVSNGDEELGSIFFSLVNWG